MDFISISISNTNIQDQYPIIISNVIINIPYQSLYQYLTPYQCNFPMWMSKFNINHCINIWPHINIKIQKILVSRNIKIQYKSFYWYLTVSCKCWTIKILSIFDFSHTHKSALSVLTFINQSSIVISSSENWPHQTHNQISIFGKEWAADKHFVP